MDGLRAFFKIGEQIEQYENNENVKEDEKIMSKQITSEEIKLQKFEIIVSDLWEKFGGYKYDTINDKNPLKYLFGQKSNNEYGQIILDKSFNESVTYKTNRCYNDYSYRLEDDNINSLIKACRCCNNHIGCNISTNCNLSSQLIFFALLFISVDNDTYNEKINIISDMAYLIGFNVEMMKDWVYVVKSVLSAEKINLDKLNTEEAKGFFRRLV